MSADDLQLLAFSSEDCIALSQSDSLEFGVFKPEAIESVERRRLLEKAVLYFDSIIAHTVLELEKERALEESEVLAEAELTARDSVSLLRHKLYEEYTRRFNSIISPKVYLFLGHFQLLLQRFDDALSAYLKYESLRPVESSRDCAFLYGLGICCFRFNAFHKASRLFQQILYLQPWFSKAKEIHIRLGYVNKLQKKFEPSLKHFRQALNDSSPATFSCTEIRFHIAHLFEVCGKSKLSISEYQKLLEEKTNVPVHIRHLCLRQLAWLHHTGAGVIKGDENDHNDCDVQWLQSALELDNTNGKTWYILGRCQAALNRVQEAFAAYRSSIDKTEASADTWCSIGVLYQEQSQPMDALQAYFCAVQLDKCHVAAWANLGTLYESMQQYKEALKCYKNAVNADKNNELKPELRARLSVMQQILPRLPEKFLNSSTSGNSSTPHTSGGGGTAPGCGSFTKLPTVDEAWNLPIPAELTQRQMQLMLQEAQSHGDESNSGGLCDDKQYANLLRLKPLASVLKRRDEKDLSATSKPDESEYSTSEAGISSKKARDDSPPDSFPLNAQQTQMLQTLQLQENLLNAAQRQLLNQLQSQALRFHQRHVSQKNCTESSGENSRVRRPYVTSTVPPSPSQRAPAGDNNVVISENSSCTNAPDTVDLFPTEEEDIPAVVCSPNADHLPEEDLTFLTDDLLAQLNRSETAANLDLVELALFANAASSEQHRPSSNNHIPSDDRCSRFKSESDISNTGANGVVKAENPRLETKPSKPVSSSEPENPLSDTRGTSPIRNEPMDLYAYLTRPLHPPTSITASLTINMTSSQILNAIRGLGRSGGPWWPAIIPEDSPIPCPPSKPFPPPPKDKLLPPTPSVYLENRKDVYSPELMRFCFSQPCVVIRGLASALRMDLGLFSTKTLVEANPAHRIEVRTQVPQPPDVNRDSKGYNVWFYESPRTVTTIEKFAAYQARSFVEAVRNEKIYLSRTTPSQNSANAETGFTAASATRPREGPGRYPELSEVGSLKAGCVMSDTPFSETAQTDAGKSTRSTMPCSSSGSGQMPPRIGKPKFIRFGTNCDLSDEKKWLPQLHELTKLPTFLRVVSAFNILSHVGYPLLGMNTVQLYLKVPGCRTPAHQENNCFSAANINVGPGDCEWFAVPEKYWGAIHDLCELNNVDYLTGSWWPHLETLYNEEIPVYRFIQRPGDLVWVNAGTVHWVQAIGWCNNIAWNIGPLTARQYQMAVDRYEFNRLRGVKSVVPMIHVSWQLAKNIKISDAALYELIKQTLLRSFVQSQLATDFIEKSGLPIKRHGKRSDDVAHSCHDCEVEVFNLLFVIAQEKKLVVRCLDCSRAMDPTLRSFTILAEYYIHELAEIYDEFQLQTQPLTAYPVGKT